MAIKPILQHLIPLLLCVRTAVTDFELSVYVTVELPRVPLEEVQINSENVFFD